MSNSVTIPPRTFGQNLSRFMRSRGARFIIMIALIMVMAIPIFMVWGIVADRSSYQRNAMNEVSEMWGGRVALGGPFLYVPVTKTVTKNRELEDGSVIVEKSDVEGAPVILLSESTKIRIEVENQIRKRGIFDVPVYQSRFNVEAILDKSRISPTLKTDETVRWNEAELVFKLPSRRSFFCETTITVNGEDQTFEPGTPVQSVSGIRIPFSLAAEKLEVSAQFGLNGAQSLSVSPLSRDTAVLISSDWPDPSFQGSFLPVERNISEDGFSATWKVPHLALNIPQVSRSTDVLNPNQSQNYRYTKYGTTGFSDPTAFGVNFIKTLDFYQLVERSVKYGFLFVSLTFLTLYLLEGLTKAPVHPAQFVLIGVSEATFFLLLLAFAEQIGFNLAYVLASVATIGLLTFYGMSALRLGKRAYLLTTLLILLYAVLYLILKSADYALLIGSLLCFGAIATTMITTRNERWYNTESSD